MEPEALELLCRLEWPRLVGALSLYTGDRDLAEDLAQETLARLCRDWPKVQRLAAPSAWTHRVAMNLARSHWRRLGVSRRAQPRIVAGARTDPDPADPAGVIAVRDAVRRLPVRQRAALVLRYFGDFSVREVAQILRCPEGTVKTLTRSGIQSLRDSGLLDEDETLSDEPRGT